MIDQDLKQLQFNIVTCKSSVLQYNLKLVFVRLFNVIAYALYVVLILSIVVYHKPIDIVLLFLTIGYMIVFKYLIREYTYTIKAYEDLIKSFTELIACLLVMDKV